jgi:dihydroflavonol-4-reductase
MVGIRVAEAAAMHDANVAGTGRVIDAAVEAGVPRILYVSTVNVFGDTHRAIVDESYIRDLSAGFLSVYDETKYRSHELARERAAAGAPVVIAMPGGIYGPGDTSQLGEQIQAAMAGKLRSDCRPTCTRRFAPPTASPTGPRTPGPAGSSATKAGRLRRA